MTDPSQLGQETQTIIDIKDAAKRLETYLAPDKFEGHDQEILVGMSNIILPKIEGMICL